MKLSTPLAPLILVAAVSATRAESYPEEAVALGWQTEHADAIVVATVNASPAPIDGTRAARLSVLETIRGRIAPGEEAVVAVRGDGHAAPWIEGKRHLVFLRQAAERAAHEGTSSARFEPVTGAYGFRFMPERGPESRFPGLVREFASVLDDTGRVHDEQRLRVLLVGWMDDAEPGVAWSAATDFVRHSELHVNLTADERGRVVESFRRQPFGKSTKRALAFAAAATRHPSAAGALADALLAPKAQDLGGAIAEALRRLDDPASVQTEVLARLGKAESGPRARLVDALGVVGRAPSVPAVRAALEDAAAEVRVAAAHTLGRIARNVREDDPEGRIDATRELLALLGAARTDAEMQAAVWALAQTDDPKAFDALRAAAGGDERDQVRRFAEEYLKQPRQDLVFD